MTDLRLAERYLEQLRGKTGRSDTPRELVRQLAQQAVDRVLREHASPEQAADPTVRANAQRMVDLVVEKGLDALLAPQLERRQRNIEEAAASSVDGLDTDQHPLVAHLRTGRLNAVSMLVADDYLVLLEEQLPWFISELSNVVSWAIPRTEGRDDSGTPTWQFSMYVADVTRRIETEQSVAAWFTDLVVTYAVTGTIGSRLSRSMPSGYLQLAMDLDTATTYFVLGHEYAHVALGHLSKAQPTAGVLPVDEPTLEFSWNQELEADVIGLMIALNALVKHERLSYRRAFLGAGLFFDALDVMDRAVAILQTGDEDARQLGSHPPSHLRKQRVREAVAQMSEVIPDQTAEMQLALDFDDVQSAAIRLLWERTRPVLVNLHRQGVPAAHTWHATDKEAPTPFTPTFDRVAPHDPYAMARERDTIDRGHPEASPPAMIRLGSTLEDRGDLAGAEELYRRAIASGHRHAVPRGQARLGHLLQQRGDLAAARELYEAAIASSDGEAAAIAMFRLALLLHGAGDTATARALYQQAVDSGQPNVVPGALQNLAVLLLREGAVGEAATLFQRAADTGDTDAAPQAQLMLGVLAQRANDHTEAQARYQQAIESGHPAARPRALHGLGQIMQVLGDEARARELYRQALDSGHQEVVARTLYDLGALAEQAGQFDAAAIHYRRAADSAQPAVQPAALARLSSLRLRHGDVDGARELLRLAQRFENPGRKQS